MKKNIKILILALCLTVLSAVFISANAAEIIESGECGENLTWTFDTDGTLTISGTGDMKNYPYPKDWPSARPWAKYIDSFTKLVINEGVTSLSTYAFYDCTSLTTVDIPASLEKINGPTFYNCTALTTVNITDLESWCKMYLHQDNANPLYYAHDLYLNGDKIVDLVIPESITEIPDNAFYGCSMESVAIHENVTSIGDEAFYKCTSLKAVHINDLEAWCKIVFSYEFSNPLYHGKNLYLNKTKIDDLVIPETITTIPKYTFYGGSFNSVTIPKTLESVGKDAFYCTTLKNVYISDLEAWCGIDFYNSSSNPLDKHGAFYLNGTEITDLVIPETITDILTYTFSGGNFTSIIIPDNTVYIRSGAFKSCGKLREIEIPDKVKIIDDYAFYSCSNLHSVTLPAGLESIGEMAFNSYYSKLSDVYYQGTEAQWNLIEIGNYNSDFDKATIHFLGGMSGETMLDENFKEVPIPENALIVAIFRKNATGDIIEEEAYGINFEGTNYPGAVEVPVDGIWVIKLVDPGANILTSGQKYTYSVFTNGQTIADNLTYTVK